MPNKGFYFYSLVLYFYSVTDLQCYKDIYRGRDRSKVDGACFSINHSNRVFAFISNANAILIKRNPIPYITIKMIDSNWNQSLTRIL